jgi:hypothetical protein
MEGGIYISPWDLRFIYGLLSGWVSCGIPTIGLVVYAIRYGNKRRLR